MDVRAELLAFKKDAEEAGVERRRVLTARMVESVREVAKNTWVSGQSTKTFYVGTYALEPDDVDVFQHWNGSVLEGRDLARCWWLLCQRDSSEA